MRNTVQLLILTTIPGCILLSYWVSWGSIATHMIFVLLLYMSFVLLPPQPAVRQRKLSRAGDAPAAHLPWLPANWEQQKPPAPIIRTLWYKAKLIIGMACTRGDGRQSQKGATVETGVPNSWSLQQDHVRRPWKLVKPRSQAAKHRKSDTGKTDVLPDTRFL